MGTKNRLLRPVAQAVRAVLIFGVLLRGAEAASIQVTMSNVQYGDRLVNDHFGFSSGERKGSWEESAAGWMGIMMRDTHIDIGSMWSLVVAKEAGADQLKNGTNRMPPIFLGGNWPMKNLELRWIRDRKWNAAGAQAELDSLLVLHDGYVRIFQFRPEPIPYSTLYGLDAVIRSDLLPGARTGPVYFDSELGVVILPLFNNKEELFAIEASISTVPNPSDRRREAALRSLTRTRLARVLASELRQIEVESAERDQKNQAGFTVEEVSIRLNEIGVKLEQSLSSNGKALLRKDSTRSVEDFNALLSRMTLPKRREAAGLSCRSAFH